jgi:hypothetical protein
MISTLAYAEDSAVTKELWTSFVGLMRSHLGALQTMGKLVQVRLVETSPNSFTMGDLSGNLMLSLNDTGRGKYQLQRCGTASDQGDWTLHRDATVCVDQGAPEDMELAVEAFCRKLWARGQQAVPQPLQPGGTIL